MCQMLISLLILFNYFISGAYLETQKFTEGEEVKITCNIPPPGTFVFWFRILETGVEAIGTFNMLGDVKTPPDATVFDYGNMKREKAIILKGFQKNRDSGTYGCGKLNNNKIDFGPLTSIEGKPESTPAVKVVTAHVTPGSTAQPCQCPTKSKPGEGCPIVIWAPLTAACSIIFLTLIIIICHCNRIRTRRCPHHYKRKPKNNTPARQAMGERYH